METILDSNISADSYNQHLDNYYQKQIEAQTKKEEDMLEHLMTEFKTLRSKVGEYQMNVNFWKKQVYLMPENHKQILRKAVYTHQNMITKVYNFRLMLEEREYEDVFKRSKNIDKELIIQIIRRFCANLDLLKNALSLANRKDDNYYYPQTLYYDLKKIGKNVADLYDILNV
jgi:hypothetical protein